MGTYSLVRRHRVPHCIGTVIPVGIRDIAIRAFMNSPQSTQSILLALNLGSSTLKAAHYHHEGNALIPHGDRLDIPVITQDDDRTSEVSLLERVEALLPNDALFPDVIAHRIVHGGPRLAPALLTDELTAELSTYAPLAPLHQMAALALVSAARSRWPDAKHIAVFDTAWHATLAHWSRRLPVPQALHDAGVMRYGFHGLAFQSAMRQLSALDDTASKQRVVLAHLGSGCSLCAVDQGHSIDTSMSMTPLDGLPMATRSGNLDPSVVLFMQRHMKMSLTDIEKILWRESGLLGVSGTSGDMQHLLTASDNSSKLAVEQFVMRVAQGIASMATSLGGMDALVFTGGIGTHSPIIRQRVVDHLAWTGLRLDQEHNNTDASRLDANDSRAKIWSITVDEEFELGQAAITFPE